MAEFQQPTHALYACNIYGIPLGYHDINIIYVEEHTEQTVEFPHSHREYEILYVTEGAISVLIDGSVQPVTATHFLFINKDVLHNVLYDPNVKKTI